MRFAICNELYHDRDPRAAMQHARGLGYQGWEIAPFTLADSIADFSLTQRKQYAQMAADEGLEIVGLHWLCLLYTSPSPRDATLSRMPSSA